MKKHFGFSLFSVGIAAGLMPMLFMLMIMPSSTDGHEVFVMTMDEQLLEEHGDLLTIELKKGASAIYVTTLKQKIQQKIGISPLKQTLRSKNPYAIALKSDDIINFSGIVFLSLDEFAISVWYYGKFSVWVKGTDTVAILKMKIQGIIHRKPKSLRTLDSALVVNAMSKKTSFLHNLIESAGNVLEQSAFGTGEAQQKWRKTEKKLGKISGPELDDDGKTMTYYDFDNGGKDVHVLSTSESRFEFEFEIYVWYVKKPYTIVVNREDTVAIVKNKIQHVIFIPYQTQTLTLRRNHGKALEENKTIDIPPGRQTLRLKHPYAKALEDDKTMEYYDSTDV